MNPGRIDFMPAMLSWFSKPVQRRKLLRMGSGARLKDPLGLD
jgi:hypothetical protein